MIISRTRAVLSFALAVGFSGVVMPVAAEAPPANWVAAWATALQPIPGLAEPPPLYRAPATDGRTVRQIVYPTLSGARIRVRVSNVYSKTPLVIEDLQLGVSAGGAALQPGTSAGFSFGGRRGIQVAPGAEVLSDPLPYDIRAGRAYALSAFLGGQQEMTAWHRVSKQFNYVSLAGDHAADVRPDAYRQQFTQFAWLSELSVDAPGAVTLAAIGDSITDGLRSSTNRNQRWPDALARRLAAEGESGVGVLNLGISGNRLLSDSACYGEALERRFTRDALARPGVKAVIVLIGINDLNFAAMPEHAGLDCDAPHTVVDARMLIDGYRRLIEAAHREGVAIYGATLTPADLPPSREALRQSLNTWIRTAGAFDGVVDFDAVLRDPTHPARLQRQYDSGDGIHPNDAGDLEMARAVPVQQIVAAARRR
jgi:lysophospholipase L1-like esterase